MMIPKQNYGAPKITVELRKTGEISERTVGTYMRQKWESVLSGANHGRSPKIPISALNYKISSMSSLILIVRMQSGVRILPHLDNRWICLSDQCYGFYFPENHSLDAFRNTGSYLA